MGDTSVVRYTGRAGTALRESPVVVGQVVPATAREL